LVGEAERIAKQEGRRKSELFREAVPVKNSTREGLRENFGPALHPSPLGAAVILALGE
jgi:hypothetical protein